jgi:hypothetical protein
MHESDRNQCKVLAQNQKGHTSDFPASNSLPHECHGDVGKS